jgi:hypothetical protein
MTQTGFMACMRSLSPNGWLRLTWTCTTSVVNPLVPQAPDRIMQTVHEDGVDDHDAGRRQPPANTTAIVSAKFDRRRR